MHGSGSCSFGRKQNRLWRRRESAIRVTYIRGVLDGDKRRRGMKREGDWEHGWTVILNREGREGLAEKVTMSKDLNEEKEEAM